MADLNIGYPPPREYGEERKAFFRRLLAWSTLSAAVKKLSAEERTAFERACRDGLLVWEGESWQDWDGFPLSPGEGGQDRGGGNPVRAAVTGTWASFAALAVKTGLGRASQIVSFGRKLVRRTFGCGGPWDAIDLQGMRLAFAYHVCYYAFNRPFVLLLFVGNEGEFLMSLQGCTWGLSEAAMAGLHDILKPYTDDVDSESWCVSGDHIGSPRLPLPVARSLASRMFEVALDCKPTADVCRGACDGAAVPADVAEIIEETIAGERPFPIHWATPPGHGRSGGGYEGESPRMYTLRMDSPRWLALEQAKQQGFLVSAPQATSDGLADRDRKLGDLQLYWAYRLWCAALGRPDIHVYTIDGLSVVYFRPGPGKSLSRRQRLGMVLLSSPFLGEGDLPCLHITEQTALLAGVPSEVARVVASRLYDLTVD